MLFETITSSQQQCFFKNQTNSNHTYTSSDLLTMSAEINAEEIWNAYYDKFGCEPKNGHLLLKFINSWEQDFKNLNISYKSAREIFNKYKGSGRITHKLETTSSDIIKALPTKKAQKDAKDENILKLVSILKLQLLVNGYIRNMNKTFLYIIPSIISQLCLNYCHLPNIVILLNKLHQIQIADLITQNLWKCNLIEPETNTQHKAKWSMSSGIIYKKCINLPSQIVKTYKNKTADIIFQAQHKYCNAILFDLNYVNYESLDCHQFNLPLFNIASRELIGNCLLFNEKIGLISVGGGNKQYPYSKNIHLLPWKDFDDIDDEKQASKWQWETLPGLSFPRGQSCAVFVEDTKFMTISGSTVIFNENGYGGHHKSYQYQNSVELYDLITKESKLISSVNRPRFAAGICYDENMKRVYLGGGVCGFTGNDNQYVESYDTDKNKWYASIPKTTKNHKYFPILWTQNGGDLLFIASSKVVEYIDLRVYGAKWNIMSNNEDKSLLNVFGDNYYSSPTHNRLLK